MATKMLQVRNVPEDMHAELRRRAAAAGMTLSEYVLRELRKVVARPTMEEIFERARRSETTVTMEEIVGSIRAERDQRS
jgi:plasmid stability protein